jgi:hypothetical protein
VKTAQHTIINDLSHLDGDSKEIVSYQAALWEGWSSTLPPHADDLSDDRPSSSQIMKTIQQMTKILTGPALVANLVGREAFAVDPIEDPTL